MLAIALVICTATMAQTDLTGRRYYNANILKDELESKMRDLERTITEKRQEAITKAEQEKGRKLTTEEIAQIDEHIAQAKKVSEALAKGMTTEVTVEFKSKEKCVMKMDVNIKESVMKAAGIGWAKRKMLKAAMAIAPSTHKAKYIVEGKLVILDDGEEKDTLTLSADGKQLYGKDEGKTFILTRVN